MTVDADIFYEKEFEKLEGFLKIEYENFNEQWSDHLNEGMLMEKFLRDRILKAKTFQWNQIIEAGDELLNLWHLFNREVNTGGISSNNPVSVFMDLHQMLISEAIDSDVAWTYHDIIAQGRLEISDDQDLIAWLARCSVVDSWINKFRSDDWSEDSEPMGQPDFTLNQKIDAVLVLLDAVGLDRSKIDEMPIANFIAFLTRNKRHPKMKNWRAYKLLLGQKPRSEERKVADLEFVKSYFKHLDLESVVDNGKEAILRNTR